MRKTLLLAFVSMFAMQAQAATQDLIDSVKKNDVSAVLKLLNNGEDVNGTDASGTTALHYAVAYDNDMMTGVLLSRGADLNKANNKGWTPLKIAEKKDLKKVTPVLEQYKQVMQKIAVVPVNAEVQNTVEAAKEAPAEAVQAAEVKAVAVVEEAKAVVPQAVPAAAVALPVVQAKEPEVKVAEVVEVKKAVVAEPVVAVVDDKEKIANQTANIENAVAKIENNQDEQIDVMEQAAQAVIDARSAQTKAEAEAKIMANEVKQLKAEKAELEAKLAESIKAQNKPTEIKPEAVAKVEQKKEKVKTKPVPKPVKPVLQKKPVYKAPQPIVKKIEVKPSTMVEGINAGDEEIVYCLDYLGNGENDNMKRAAGYFAASASISEARYKEIVDKANSFFMKADDIDMTRRDNDCSVVITPKDKDKQNQIVRSINKSVGY